MPTHTGAFANQDKLSNESQLSGAQHLPSDWMLKQDSMGGWHSTEASILALDPAASSSMPSIIRKICTKTDSNT